MTQRNPRGLRTSFVLLLLSMFSFAHAQPDPGQDPDAGVPIDGGVSLVIVAAVGYAAKKGIEKRRKDKRANEANQESGSTE